MELRLNMEFLAILKCNTDFLLLTKWPEAGRKTIEQSLYTFFNLIVF